MDLKIRPPGQKRKTDYSCRNTCQLHNGIGGGDGTRQHDTAQDGHPFCPMPDARNLDMKYEMAG
jgi:hypothetical protein